MSGHSVDYDGFSGSSSGVRRTDLDGSVYHFQAEAHYAVDAQSQISFLGGSILEDTDDPAFSNISPFVGFGYQRKFPYRITAGIQPLLFFRLFDEPLGAFGKTREDVALRVKTTLIYRTDLFSGGGGFRADGHLHLHLQRFQHRAL